MAALDERPVKLIQEGDIGLQNMEKILNWNDEQLSKLDGRRIAQIAILDNTANLADVISKINEIITSLNGSDLTTD